MQSKAISENQIEVLKEAIKVVKELCEVHTNNNSFNLDDSTSLDRIFCVMYLDTIKDLIRSCATMESILDMSEEEFVNLVTDEGKRSISETEKLVMSKALLDILEV